MKLLDFNNIPKIYLNSFIKIPNGLIELSDKYNSCLNLVYIYLMINRNMIGKANTSIFDIQKDILKTNNQNVIQQKTDDILDSYYILSNSITKKDNTVAINSLISIEKYENKFDFGELKYESLRESLEKIKINNKIGRIKQLRLSIIPYDCEDLTFTKLYLQEYITLMDFVYNNPKNKTYKITDLTNLYLLVKSKVAKNSSFNKKYSKNKKPYCVFLDKLVKESSLSRPTLTKYLDALCDLDLLEKYKKEVKVYYKLKHEEFI